MRGEKDQHVQTEVGRLLLGLAGDGEERLDEALLGEGSADLLGLQDLLQELQHGLHRLLRDEDLQQAEDTEHHLRSLVQPRLVLLALKAGQETDVVLGSGVQVWLGGGQRGEMLCED